MGAANAAPECGLRPEIPDGRRTAEGVLAGKAPTADRPGLQQFGDAPHRAVERLFREGFRHRAYDPRLGVRREIAVPGDEEDRNAVVPGQPSAEIAADAGP